MSKRSRKRCGNYAIVGLDVCRMHGGTTPRSMRKALRTKALDHLGAALPLLAAAEAAGSAGEGMAILAAIPPYPRDSACDRYVEAELERRAAERIGGPVQPWS